MQKSNSRVASVGRLRLHVESFRQAKNTSGTQTEQVRNHLIVIERLTMNITV